MRTTTLLVSLALLGLAAAPTASAAAIGDPTIYAGPCSYEGDTLQAQVLDATYSIKCTGVDLARFAAEYGVDAANVVLKMAEDMVAILVGIADPVIVAVNALCDMTLEDCDFSIEIAELTDFTLTPPTVDLASTRVLDNLVESTATVAVA